MSDKTYWPPELIRTRSLNMVQPAVPIRVAVVAVNDGEVDVFEETFLGILVSAADHYAHHRVAVGTGPRMPATPAAADVRSTDWRWDGGRDDVRMRLVVWSDEFDAPEAVDGHEGEGNWQRIAAPATETAEGWQRRVDRAAADIRKREEK